MTDVPSKEGSRRSVFPMSAALVSAGSTNVPSRFGWLCIMRTEPEAEGPASAPASCLEAESVPDVASLTEGASAPDDDDELPCASLGAIASVQASVVEHVDPCGEPDVPHAITTKELVLAARTATLEREASDMVV